MFYWVCNWSNLSSFSSYDALLSDVGLCVVCGRYIFQDLDFSSLFFRGVWWMSSHALDLVVCVNPSSSSSWVWVGKCYVWCRLTQVVLDKGPLNGWVFVIMCYWRSMSVDSDSVLLFSCPWSEGWPHHGRTFSIYLCSLLFWLTQGVLSTSWCCPSRPCLTFLACVHLALFLHYFFRCFLIMWP